MINLLYLVVLNAGEVVLATYDLTKARQRCYDHVQSHIEGYLLDDDWPLRFTEDYAEVRKLVRK